MCSSAILVIGSWEEEVSQGFCLAFEHRLNKESSLRYPASVLHNLEGFASLLQEIEPVSLQLASDEQRVTFDYFFKLIQIIGANCPNLACLAVQLDLEEGEQEFAKSIEDLDLDLKGLTLTAKQKKGVDAWLALISGVKTTLEHINVTGSHLEIPYFVLKAILAECPNFDYIEGGVSGKCEIVSPAQLTNVVAKGQETLIIKVALLDCPAEVNLAPFSEKIYAGKFKNLKILHLDWNQTMDLSFLESPTLENLVELFVRNRGATSRKVPTLVCFIPDNSKLRELTIIGLELTPASWAKIGERATLLRRIQIQGGGNFGGNCLSPLCELPRLEMLEVNAASITATGQDIGKLFAAAGDSATRFCLRVCFGKCRAWAGSRGQIEAFVAPILEALKNEESLEGRSGIRIEFDRHEGGFEELRSAVEEQDFKFEQDDDFDYRIWNCICDEGNPRDRYLTLVEKK